MHQRTLIILSIVLVILPWLGIPSFINNILISLCALNVLFFLYLSDKKGLSFSNQKKEKRDSDSYVENEKDTTLKNNKMV